MAIKYQTREKVKRRDGYRCLRCGTRRNLTMDHVVPRCHNGADHEVNLQTLCAECNQWKADRTIDYRDVAAHLKMEVA